MVTHKLKRCPKCNNEVGDTWRICIYCEAKLNPTLKIVNMGGKLNV
jgi:hypothetical protein